MVGDIDEAIDQFRSVGETNYPVVAVRNWSSHELATTLSMRDREGDCQEALGIWNETLKRAERLGSLPLANRIKKRVESRYKTAKASSPHGLSPRESEVLGHLSEGKTNSEISDALFISPKTVENHVARILAKLRVGNRTEAAAFAHQHDLT